MTTSMWRRKTKMQAQIAALMNLPPQSRNTIWAANQIWTAMNTTKNAYVATRKQNSANRIHPTPLLAWSSVQVQHTPASTQRSPIRLWCKLDMVENSCRWSVLPDLHSMADVAEIIREALRGASWHSASRQAWYRGLTYIEGPRDSSLHLAIGKPM
jgi:hypothetical protein